MTRRASLLQTRRRVQDEQAATSPKRVSFSRRSTARATRTTRSAHTSGRRRVQDYSARHRAETEWPCARLRRL